jgi:hypothetical protein
MNKLKLLKLILIMACGLYPIAELTRLILISGRYYYPEMEPQFYTEVSVMWIMYLSIPIIFYKINHGGKNE